MNDPRQDVRGADADIVEPDIKAISSRPQSSQRLPVKHIVIASIMRRHGTTGVQTHFNALEHGLRSLGVEVEFVNSFSHYASLSYPVYAVRPLVLTRVARSWGVWWYRYWHYLFLYWSLKKRLRRNVPDIVNAQCPLSAAAAMRVREEGRYRYPVVLTCHFNLSQAEEFRGKGEISEQQRIYDSIRAFERMVLGSVDGLVFVSQFARDHILGFAGVKHPRAVVIPNGVDAARNVRTDKRSELGIPSDAFIIACVGTLEPRKNQVFLLDVLKRLLAVDDKFVLLLVGDGQDRQRITEIVGREGWDRHVRLPGFRPDVRELLAASDLYCHPAVMESFGIAIVEAYAARLPVIASPVGGIREVVQHGRTGFLLAPSSENVDTYAEQILTLRQDEKLRDAVVNEGYRYYVDNFTTKIMAQRYRDYYAEIAAGVGSVR